MPLAQTSTTPQLRDHFARLARTWVRLADDLERTWVIVETDDDRDRAPSWLDLGPHQAANASVLRSLFEQVAAWLEFLQQVKQRLVADYLGR